MCVWTTSSVREMDAEGAVIHELPRVSRHDNHRAAADGGAALVHLDLDRVRPAISILRLDFN